MSVWAYDDNRLAHPLGLNGSDNGGGGSAVDHDLVLCGQTRSAQESKHEVHRDGSCSTEHEAVLSDNQEFVVGTQQHNVLARSDGRSNRMHRFNRSDYFKRSARSQYCYVSIMGSVDELLADDHRRAGEVAADAFVPEHLAGC